MTWLTPFKGDDGGGTAMENMGRYGEIIL